MILARYPNIDQNGFWNFIQIAKVINNETFQFDDSRYVHKLITTCFTFFIH